jgi:hypothetical protein
MRRKVTVVILSVCLSFTTKYATYLVYTWKTRCHRVLYGVFKVFVVWLSLKMLRSRVMASFADFLAPWGELSMFPSTVMAYFQLEGYNIIWFSIYKLDPTPRLAHHYVLAHWLLLAVPTPHVSTLPLPHFNVSAWGHIIATPMPSFQSYNTLLHAHKILIFHSKTISDSNSNIMNGFVHDIFLVPVGSPTQNFIRKCFRTMMQCPILNTLCLSSIYHHTNHCR